MVMIKVTTLLVVIMLVTILNANNINDKVFMKVKSKMK